MLYASVVACIELLFQYAEVRFPDALSFSFTAASNNIRTAASVLLVTYPVFLLSSWFLRKIIREHPEAAEFKPRKWLTYLTLFAAGITIIVDLIVLFNTYWGGEITPRFIIKVFIVLLVGVALFAYFVWDLRNTKQSRGFRKILGWGTLVLVLSSIGVGFLIVGSPQLQRERRFDEIRIQDIDSLYWQIISYYQAKAILPQTLQDIETHSPGFVIPKDPETQASYEYNVQNSATFELCAVFSAPSIAGTTNNSIYPARDPVYAWVHEAGRACLSQTVNAGMISNGPSGKLPAVIPAHP